MTNDEAVDILVVDDLPEKLLVIETILEGLGQNIVKARSGREALRYLLDREFAVILLDVNMPDMDGLETAAMIRQRRQTSQTPIIFITAFGDDVHSAQGYSLGAVDYIYSPVVPEILRAKVGVFVDLFKKTLQVRRQAEERVALVREQAARAAAEEATRRSAFLAEASKVLTKSLDYEATLRGVARLLVPELGDFAALTVVDDRSGSWDNLVVLKDPIDGSRKKFRPSRPELDPALCETIHRVLASGMPEHVPEDGGTGPWAEARVRPLEARGRIMGTLALAGGQAGPRPGTDDLALAEDLAGRAAIAIDNARLYRDIQEDDRRKNEFLAMLAHELRNPLAPIRNAVEILQHLGLKDGDLGWASDVISRQVEQMVRLVDDLLDISRITGGKVQLRKEPIDVASVVARAVETSRPLIEARGHRLDVDLPGEPLWVIGDRTRLSQVLANVLNNAAKYTANGGEIALRVGRESEEAVFRVHDTGIGIPPEMLSRVFDLFTQVDRSLDRSEGGLGIGLTLVHRLMELHGGRVEARSEGPGRGSEFILRLPAASANGQHGGAEAIPTPADTAARADRRAPCRILIVDDNQDSARTLERLLRIPGHEVHTAPDGPAGLGLMDAVQPDIVLLDIGLPGMDGYEVARRIRERPDGAGILLVALTGYGRAEDRARSREAGFDHHFTKPVELDALLSLIDSHGRSGRRGDAAVPAGVTSSDTVC
jgi:signal transduction histidine kinase/DNA-binding response OmpR family regulator